MEPVVVEQILKYSDGTEKVISYRKHDMSEEEIKPEEVVDPEEVAVEAAEAAPEEEKAAE